MLFTSTMPTHAEKNRGRRVLFPLKRANIQYFAFCPLACMIAQLVLLLSAKRNKNKEAIRCPKNNFRARRPAEPPGAQRKRGLPGDARYRPNLVYPSGALGALLERGLLTPPSSPFSPRKTAVSSQAPRQLAFCGRQPPPTHGSAAFLTCALLRRHRSGSKLQ